MWFFPTTLVVLSLTSCVVADSIGDVPPVKVDLGNGATAGSRKDFPPKPTEQPHDDLTIPPLAGATSAVSLITRLGPVTGTQDAKARMFYGIRYAQAPRGSLRWADPVSLKDTPFTSNPYDATTEKDGCPTKGVRNPADPLDASCLTVSEDCLFLNVFAPLTGTGHPVLVYLHGGNFQSNCGSAPIFNGGNFANRNDVVVVTINYRLAALGFLWAEADGNWGIKDQKAALEWVVANIADYGGDPAQVTLMGQSAGGDSTGILLLWDASSTLFQRAILSSAPFSIPERQITEGEEMTELLAAQLACTDGAGAPNMTCLRELPWQTIVDNQNSPDYSTVLRFLCNFQVWAPVVDGVVVTSELLYWPTSKAIDKPIMIGTTQDEGLPYVNALGPAADGLDYFEYGVLINTSKGAHSREIFSKYPRRLFGSWFSLYDNREEAYKLVTDLVFYCSARNFSVELQNQSPGQKVWMYVFDYGPNLDSVDSFFASICTERACHGIDVPFTLNTVPLLKEMGLPATSTDLQYSDEMSDYIADFVKDGDIDLNRPSRWALHEPSDLKVLKVGPSRFNEESLYKDDKCDMWDRIGYFLDA